MAKESFRYLHAGEFHLERPLQDLIDLPDHLRASWCEAPWKAAELVFDTALLEQVDFLLLTGDLLHPAHVGPAGIAFLLEQLDRLAEAKIPIYWATGSNDHIDHWPEAIHLPDHVTRFSSDRSELVLFKRAGHPLASLIGRSSDGRQTLRGGDFDLEPGSTFSIAVGHGEVELEALQQARISHWAMGGQHQSQRWTDATLIAHQCGSPQGRSFNEPGSHGCYLHEVDSHGKLQSQYVELDTVRYLQAKLTIDELSAIHELRPEIARRMQRMIADHAGRMLLVRWEIELDASHLDWTTGNSMDELLQWLRAEFGHGRHPAWTVDIQWIPPQSLPAKWSQEDTILGDFLRVAEAHRKENLKHLSWSATIDSETPASALWKEWLSDERAADRTEALGHAQWIGCELLRGQSVDLLAGLRKLGLGASKTL
jgi:DNA repair exonuclease SbcCD nuclease subunit